MNVTYTSLLFIISLYSWAHATTSFIEKLRRLRTQQGHLIDTSPTDSLLSLIHI